MISSEAEADSQRYHKQNNKLQHYFLTYMGSGAPRKSDQDHLPL